MVFGSLKLHRPVSDETTGAERDDRLEMERPGREYAQYRYVQELSTHAEAFYKEAAHLIGIRLETLVRAVLHTEAKLQDWAHQMKRRELIAQSSRADEAARQHDAGAERHEEPYGSA